MATTKKDKTEEVKKDVLQETCPGCEESKRTGKFLVEVKHTCIPLYDKSKGVWNPLPHYIPMYYNEKRIR